jgi:filamentous hemagglutinin family protein
MKFRLFLSVAQEARIHPQRNDSMRHKISPVRFSRNSLTIAVLSAIAGMAQALPQGGTVAAGSGSINQSGNNMTVNQGTQKMIVDWQSFGIASGESVQFIQPSSSSVALNRVLGNNSSEIFGSLSANGQVFLTNPNGILFGSTAQVDVGGLVASTLNISNQDFLAGDYTFSGDDGGRITNQGTLTARDGGVIALLAPEVRNEGLILAREGSVGLGAGTRISLDLSNGLRLEVEESVLNAVVENHHAIRAEGGVIILSASAQQSLLSGMINNTGVLEAGSVSEAGGRILLNAGTVTTTGALDVSSTHGEGGRIALNGAAVALGGELNADGTDGGMIHVSSSGALSLADQVHARGHSGKGGTVAYVAGGRLIENNGSRTDVSGAGDGGRIGVSAQRLFSSGTYLAQGQAGHGGVIALTAQQDANFFSAQLDASGAQQGGTVNIGGSYRGVAAQQVLLNDSTHIDASSSAGMGGTVVIGSEQQTTWLGSIEAGGSAGGGSVDIASQHELRRSDTLNVNSGSGGTFSLQAQTTTMGTAEAASGWTYNSLLSIAAGNTSVALEPADLFGGAVALNAAGNRLAVGAVGDDGFNNAFDGSGAVYLFSFSDRNFNGGALEAIVGAGYTGGKNINVSNLESGDAFGSAVAFNAVGDRLAVGATGDAGAGNNASFGTGAVYLFSFDTNRFAGGELEAIVGAGYTGGKNVNVSNLDAPDQFGRAVSLNALGNRLAVGAPSDDGANNDFFDSGAAYLFSFSNTNFSGGTQQAIIGADYTGGRNIDVDGLNSVDVFGISLSLNAVGDCLAIGAEGDDGFADSAGNSGAVYLFSFDTNRFAGGELEATMGFGYTGGKNVNVTTLEGGANPGEDGDLFGSAVALNALGNRLAVGASRDDGAGNNVLDSGAAYLFSFSNTNFSGGTRQAIVGNGYTGGKNVNVALEEGDRFGFSLSLNAVNDRLAVGAFADDGFGNTVDNSGAVYLFSFDNFNFRGGELEAVIGAGYSGGNNLDVRQSIIGSGYTGAGNISVPLEPGDQFGTSVSLNANATRMAIGSADDGFANDCNACGAVYLFSFSDSSFNGGALQGVIGNGYTGGKNVNVALDANDVFGSAVSLNAIGNRLAVGAANDDGFGNIAEESGAVYLFSFSNSTFSNGTLQATLGEGYTGGKNGNVTPLEAFDSFGSGVALNAIGDRLVVGAFGDDGAGNAVNGAGAVYMFTFSSNTWSGGALEGRAGAGYTGGKNINVANLEDGDAFGSAVALNALGDRMAVGAIFDDGAGNGAESSGAAYLFSFSNTNFSGGTQQAIVGNGYTGGKNIDVTNVEAVDLFGRGVALNARGDRLVVGASNDDGAGNSSLDSGAAYVFDFSNRNFSGGTQVAILGDGYTGGNNVNVSNLEPGDAFGRSVAVNAFGTRLAVGAVGDSGAGNSTAPSSGAVYLFRQ